MSSHELAVTPPLARRRWVRVLALIAAAVVPLAFAGLTMAALSDTEKGLDRIPAAIVNQDEMVTQTGDDGTETMVLAGRLLVTELTGADSPGMDWRLSNAEEAATQLAAGEVYAVLTIPSDFSASVVSLSSGDPTRAQLRLETDDAHSYLAGAVAQSLGDGMVRAFGSELTKQYIAGIFTQFGTVGEAFTQAADGAQQLADGAGDAAAGAQQYAEGVRQYTNGVSALASGLGQLNTGAAGLDQLSSSVTGYTQGVAQLAAGIAEQTAIIADPTSDPVAVATAVAYLQGYSTQLNTVAAGGGELAAGVAGGVDGIQSGIAQSAAGAGQLARNGGQLAAGADALADGTVQLADGAGELAAGLREGADRLSGAETPGADAASVAAEPVGLEVATSNAVTQIAQVIGTYFVPLGLWAGALATFLVLPGLSRRVLASTAGSGRVLGSFAVRAGAVAAVQALLLVLLLHLVAGVAWVLLPATLGLALVAALAYTAFHQLLTVGLGRAGLVVSLLLLAVQLAAVGGIVPSQALAGPFAWLSSVSPLGWASTGLQQLVAGGETGVVVGSFFALAAFGAASLLVSRLVIRRARRASVLRMLLPAPTPA